MSWYVVRNHQGGKLRSREEMSADLESALERFESDTGVHTDSLIHEELGVGKWMDSAERNNNYSHPIMRAESHGALTLVALSVPAALHNGIADFTNVLLLAHPKSLLMIIRDPRETFSSDFGGLLLTDYRLFESGKLNLTPGEAVIRAIRSCLVCLESSLSVLRFNVNPALESLRVVELRKDRINKDLDQLEAEFGKTLAELRALVRSPEQLHSICDRVENWSATGGQGNLFDPAVVRRVTYMRSALAQLEAIIGTFIADLERAIKRSDDVSKRELLDAQRNNTYWTSALLLPNLIFAFFGQSIFGGMRDGSWFWYVSGGALVVYGVGSGYFLLYRTRNLR